MVKHKTNTGVDFYFEKAGPWQEAIRQLRQLCLGCGLTEELKWGCPCYTYPAASTEKAAGKNNIVLIHVFKEYCALLFFKGSLLQDDKGILIQQTANVQSARQARFTHVRDVVASKAVLKTYIFEAIEVEKAGLKVPLKKTAAFDMPVELKEIFASQAALKTAFNKLTPGRQRAYLLFFSAPKQSKTRTARIQKSISRIMDGKGLHDDH